MVIASSDGYFIDKIYKDSKLTKTSIFLEVDYLKKEDIVYWLNNLEQESGMKNFTLTDHQIERIWYYFGGSVWEVSSFLSKLPHKPDQIKLTDDILEKEAHKWITANKVRFQDYLGKNYDWDLFKAINEVIKTTGSFKETDLIGRFEREKLKIELNQLVQQNFFYYNPVTGKYQPQGHSFALGLDWFCTEQKNIKL